MTTEAAPNPLETIPDWARPLLPDWVGGLRDRAVTLDDIEILSRAKGGDGRTVTAYAAVFDQPTEIRDQDGHYMEQIGRAAFDRSIRERAGKINVFYNHGKDLYGQPSDRFAVPLGTPKEITTDQRGLRTVTQFNRTPLADDILEAIKSRSLRGMSFTGGFIRSDPQGPYYASSSGELTLVTRQEIALVEYGPTPIEAYDDAQVVGVRAGQLDDDEARQRAVSDTPWSQFTQADYSPEQWRRACLIDTGEGDPDSKDRYKLPVREPSGTLNRNAVHAAAAGHGIGAVQGVSPEKKQAAARTLVGLYRNQLNEDPPPGLMQMAGMSMSSGSSGGGSRSSSDEVPAAQRTEATEEPPPAQEPPTHSEGTGTTEAPTPSRRSTVDEQSMTVAERSARLDEISSRLNEIATQFAGAELDQDTQAEWDRISEEHTTHQRAIAADAARRERIAQLAEWQEQRNGSGGERVNNQRVGYGGGQGPAFHRKPENLFDLGEIRQRARSIDELPGLYRENATRVVEQARFPGLARMPGVTREAAQARAQELLDGIDAEQGPDAGALALRILITGSPTYDRAFWKAVSRGGFMGLTGQEQEALSRALSMGSATSAQLAVPFTLDPSIILTSDGATNPLRRISRVETITGRAWEGVSSAGITVGRLGEALPSTDNAPTTAQPTLTPTAVRGFVPFSIETDVDWTQMRSEMTRLLNDARDIEEASSFVTGSGTPPAPSGIQSTLTTASNVNDGVTFNAAVFNKADDAMAPRFTPRAVWLARKATYNLARTVDSNGTLYARLTEGRPPELLGYPAYEASNMPVRFTSASVFGTRYAVLGDFSNFLIIDKAGMDVEIVPHLFSNNLPTGQRGLFAIWRNNSLVVNGNAFRILVYAT